MIDNTARLWDSEGQPLATLTGHTDRVWSANFSPDGQRIVTTSNDNTARLWDSTGQLLATLSGHENGVDSASFSSDGRYIVTASWDGTAKLWEVGDEGVNLSASLVGH